MASDSESYRKIAAHRSLDPQTLCMADDHLLIVSGAYLQQYRRMYFRDIEAFSMARNTAFAATLAFILLCLAGFGALAWMIREASQTGALIFLGLAVFCSAVAAIHIARGPTVTCSLRTRVQTVRLQALSREKKALVFQDTLQRQLERFQDPFSVERFARLQLHSLETAPPIENGRRRPPKLP